MRWIQSKKKIIIVIKLYDADEFHSAKRNVLNNLLNLLELSKILHLEKGSNSYFICSFSVLNSCLKIFQWCGWCIYCVWKKSEHSLRVMCRAKCKVKFILKRKVKLSKKYCPMNMIFSNSHFPHFSNKCMHRFIGIDASIGTMVPMLNFTFGISVQPFVQIFVIFPLAKRIEDSFRFSLRTELTH